MRIFLLISATLSLLLAPVVWYLIKNRPPAATKKKYSVAYILLASVTDHEMIERGIIQSYNKSPHKELFDLTPYHVTTTDKVHIKVIADQLLQQQPDAIITVRDFCTRAVASLAKRRLPNVPIVFADLPGADKLGLIKSTKASGTNVTGIQVVDPDNQTPARYLYRIKPTISKLLIPYDLSYDATSPDGEIHKWAHKTKQYFQSKGIAATIAPFDNARDALGKLPSMLTDHDTLIYYEGGGMNTIYTGLIRLCNKAGATLFAATHAAAQEGAAITFSLDPALPGQHAWYYIEKILLEGANPATLPIKQLSNCHQLVINKKAAALQNLDLTPALKDKSLPARFI